MEKGNPRFGSWLKSIRLDRRLTLERIEEMSARLGEPISKTYLSRVEHGQTYPALPKLKALARVLKVRLGELAERFDIEETLDDVTAPPASDDDTPGTSDAIAERGIEAALRDDPQNALILFEAARRVVPRGARAPAKNHAAEPATAAGFSTGAARSRSNGAEGERIASARTRLCLAVISSSIGNYRLSKEEAEALVCAEELPDDIRLRSMIQLALSYRKLRRAALARLVVNDLLSKEETLPRKILADAHFLMGALDLDAALPRPALLHLRKASSLYRVLDAAPDLARCLQELGESYRLGGLLPEAMARYEEGLSIARRADIKSLTAELLSHIGRGYFLARNLPSALKHLFESNDLARRGDYFETLFRNYFYLRAIAIAQHDEFSRRTAERSLRALSGRTNPLMEESIQYHDEIARLAAERDEETAGLQENGGRRPVETNSPEECEPQATPV